MNIQEYTVRSNRGKPRIWIEGNRLLESGFVRGARYSVTPMDGGLAMKLDPEGRKKVSGKTAQPVDRPIIDLTGGGCCELQTGDTVLITYIEGSIIIERAEP